MAEKQFKCTNAACGHRNTIREMDYKEILTKAGEASIVSFLATLLTLPLGGVGGVAAGIYYSTTGVYNYASIECTRCGQRFMIARWTDGD